MKKNNLLKILLIVFISVVFLSWVIPAGLYENNTFTAGNIKPVGIFDLTLIPLTVFDLALPSILLVLAVGIFYGIINKTGVYAKMIDDITKKLKGKEFGFLIVTTIIMCLLSAIVGLNIGFLVIIPFIATIILKLGFSKIIAMISTFGSILVGMMCSIYGSDIAYYLNGYFGYNSDYNYHTNIFPDKIILLILLVFLLVMFVLKKAKTEFNNKNVDLEQIPLYTNNSSKTSKSWIPLFILMTLCFLLIMVGNFKWDAVLGANSGNTPFLDFYNKIMDININGFPIIQNILGTLPPLGYWDLPFIIVFILFTTILIGIVYRIKFNDILAGFIAGIKKISKLIIYIIGANLVFALLFRNGTSENFVATIINYLMNLPEKFSTLIVSITTIISGFFYNHFGTLAANMYLPTVVLTGATTELRFLASLIIQTLYGLVMFIAPTSVLLITGLAYFDISYKEWFKNIWKLLLQLLIVIVLVIIIVTIFSM